MASRSKYFDAMFRRGFAESIDGEKAVTIDLPSNEHFEAIYVYLGTGAPVVKSKYMLLWLSLRKVLDLRIAMIVTKRQK